MKNNIKKIFGCVIVLTMVVCAATAFAADETSNYSFRKGKENHYGTGGEQTFVYSHSHHADTEALIEAGIIDQETANNISEYMSKKHEDIKAMYSDMANMSPEERHTAFEERKTSRGNGLDELVDKGIITKEQYDSIKEYTENK